ncbi:hypothetical protein WOC09_23460 [Vibrio parahaemolyticus]|uniref:hypothetical protein n=1 Tax=Vibrio parahaemolyticus TaxID=670 RepID=UPI00041DC656|nr:hypothetical protein [Vibrio parahaemolyticus]EGQ8146812.1 hypothetical protein [Vibrio parahaemolyticus]EGQ8340472.1 hypothetical protein [Vibrio parahaemolyticus]EGQ8373166.1 hypothetical protein [Vibrio parahaemolyticus]EGQ8725326.1 hypothetical protein [Vibrio parahaemolyticus]EGQ8764519.1 hypothetical protein [Vibrio parahaemolyticus]
MKVDYLLTGLVNESYVEIRGLGALDQMTGEANLKINVVRGREVYDPAIIVLICCDNLRFLTADFSDNAVRGASDIRNSITKMRYGGFLNHERMGAIHSESGEELALVRAKGFLFIENNVAFSRTVIKQAYSNLYKHGGVKKIVTPYLEKVTPKSERSAHGVSDYQIVCADGTVGNGTTLYPYMFEDEGVSFLSRQAPFALKVHKIDYNYEEYMAGKDAEISIAVKGVNL